MQSNHPTILSNFIISLFNIAPTVFGNTKKKKFANILTIFE